MHKKIENMPNKTIDDFINILAKLRAPNGCPWDRKQTHASLIEHLYEEVAELADAIEDKNPKDICEELGDVLLQIVFHSQIANEKNEFDFSDVVENISNKMIRRHPHVFGEDSAETAEEVVGIWEKIKKKEKGEQRKSIMDGVPRNLSALQQARKVQKKAAHYGFDWIKEDDIISKIEEELQEVKDALKENDAKHIDEEIGDLLFSVVNLSRYRKGLSSEQLLKNGVNKFKQRFRYIEDELMKKGTSLEDSNITEMEDLWKKSKLSI